MFPKALSVRLAAAIFALALIASPVTVNMASAQMDVEVEEEVYRENTAINAMFHKLGRGVTNILTGWIEVPKNIAQEWRETDPFTGTIVGFFEGFGWGFARTVAGFYEVVSFPFPVPNNYAPVMEPEFILPTVWGERLPIFEDEFIGSGDAINAAVDYQSAGNRMNTTRSSGSGRMY